MASLVTVRPYRGADEAALITLWNEVLTHDRIDAATFCCHVLLDANFDPAGLLLAEVDGQLAGFLLSIARQVPLFGQGLEPELAWITAFGVRPAWQRQGAGQQLFDVALDRLAGLGRRRVLISPYTPNYFTPGVDVDAYPAAMSFLQRHGWQVTSMDYYDALGTVRGCLGGYARAAAVMLPPGGWVRRLAYLPDLEPAAA